MRIMSKSSNRKICWIFGIGGVLTFFLSLGMPILFAGEYLILGVIVTGAAIYFYPRYKDKPVPTKEEGLGFTV